MGETLRPIDILRQARAAITDPAKWGKGDGENTPPPDKKLCATMAIGFLPRSGLGPTIRAMRLLGEAITGDPDSAADADIQEWNDAPERTHAEVLAMFDRAIALAQASA